MRESGQTTMFDLFGQSVSAPLPSLELESAEVSRSETLAWEKEMLGVYVSEHPYAAAAAALSQHVTVVCNEVTPELSGREVVLAGMVASTRNLLTRDGKTFCAAIVEDLSGSVEVTVWPDLYEGTRDLWTEGNILLMLTRVKERGDRLQVSVQQVAAYEAGSATGAPPPLPEWTRRERNGGRNGRPAENAAPPAPIVPRRLLIALKETHDEAADRTRLADLMAALTGFPGDDEVRLVVHTRDDERVELALPSARACEELRAKVLEILAESGEARLEAINGNKS